MLTLCKPGHQLATRWNVCFMWGFSYKGLDLFSTVLWTLPPGKKIAELSCSSSMPELWYCLFNVSYLNYLFIGCDQEGQPCCGQHSWWEVQKKRRYLWFLCFSDHQTIWKHGVASLRSNKIYEHKKKNGGKKVKLIFREMVDLSLNSYVVCVGKANVFWLNYI